MPIVPEGFEKIAPPLYAHEWDKIVAAIRYAGDDLLADKLEVELEFLGLPPIEMRADREFFEPDHSQTVHERAKRYAIDLINRAFGEKVPEVDQSSTSRTPRPFVVSPDRADEEPNSQ